MRSWAERNHELAALFNPSFCGLILYTCVVHYQKQDVRGIPFPAAFLLLPIILSSSLRDSLPQTARTPFHLWINREPYIKIGLARRASNLSQITREALLFLLRQKRVTVEKARIRKGKLIRGIPDFASRTPELGELLESARILGNMFGKVPDTDNIFLSLGVTI
jgi:hypothetical protein